MPVNRIWVIAESFEGKPLTISLELLTAARRTEALLAAEALLTDIVRLAEARTLADLGPFREELSARRRAIGPPPGICPRSATSTAPLFSSV